MEAGVVGQDDSSSVRDRRYPVRSEYLVPEQTDEEKGSKVASGLTPVVRVSLDNELAFLATGIRQQLGQPTTGDEEEQSRSAAGVQKGVPLLEVVDCAVASSVAFTVDIVRKPSKGKGKKAAPAPPPPELVASVPVRLLVVVLRQEAWTGLVRNNQLIAYLTTIIEASVVGDGQDGGPTLPYDVKLLVLYHDADAGGARRAISPQYIGAVSAAIVSLPNLQKISPYCTDSEAIYEITEIVKYVQGAAKKRREIFELNNAKMGKQGETGAGQVAGKVSFDARSGYRAMLGQIPGMSFKRCCTVAQRFPTLGTLLEHIATKGREATAGVIGALVAVDDQRQLGPAIGRAIVDSLDVSWEDAAGGGDA